MLVEATALFIKTDLVIHDTSSHLGAYSMTYLLQARAHVLRQAEKFIVMAMNCVQIEGLIGIGELKLQVVETFKLSDGAIDAASMTRCLHIDLFRLIHLAEEIGVQLIYHTSNGAPCCMMVLGTSLRQVMRDLKVFFGVCSQVINLLGSSLAVPCYFKDELKLKVLNTLLRLPMKIVILVMILLFCNSSKSCCQNLTCRLHL